MSLALIGGEALTPLGDLDAATRAITAGTRAGERDPATGLRLARLHAIPSSTRTTRTVGASASLALDVARSAAGSQRFDRRTGVFVAVGGLRAGWAELAPAMAEQRADGVSAWARGLSRLHPLWMLRYLSNAAHALIAAELGAVGDGATFAGSAAAASALIAADAAIADGAIDRAIVVALDDLTADEVAVELAGRRPSVVPAAGIAAVIVTAGDELSAVDGVDRGAEPSAAAIAAVRARLPQAERDITFAPVTGWLGAAGPIVDTLFAVRFSRIGWPVHLDLGSPRSVTITASASPGQIGVVRLELTR